MVKKKPYRKVPTRDLLLKGSGLRETVEECRHNTKELYLNDTTLQIRFWSELTHCHIHLSNKELSENVTTLVTQPFPSVF